MGALSTPAAIDSAPFSRLRMSAASPCTVASTSCECETARQASSAFRVACCSRMKGVTMIAATSTPSAARRQFDNGVGAAACGINRIW